MANAASTVRVLGLALCSVALGGCPHTVTQPPLLRDALGPSWTMVPLPNSALLPGAIVRIVPPAAGASPQAGGQIDLRWLGRLADCGVPASVVVVSDAVVPGITSGSTFSLDASLGAKLAGVSAQLSGNVSSTADFTITTSTDSVLDFIGFEAWANALPNAAALATACGAILNQPGVYVVQEAFVISAGSYSFKTDAGAKIGVTPPPNVPVTASLGGDSGSSGSLAITSPVVFALKVLQPLPQGGFQVAALGQAEAKAVFHHHRARRPVAALSAPSPSLPPAPPPAPSPPLSPLELGGKSITAIEGLSAH